MCFFDNNQILSRNWRVKYNSKHSANVSTSVAIFIPDDTSNLQKQPLLNPINWLTTFHFNEEIKRNVLEETSFYDDIFLKYKTSFIEQQIQSVQISIDGMLCDELDKMPTKAGSIR